MISTTETPYLLHCPTHGMIYLTEEEYHRQMKNSNDIWRCPYPISEENICGRSSKWDDEQWEKYFL